MSTLANGMQQRMHRFNSVHKRMRLAQVTMDQNATTLSHSARVIRMQPYILRPTQACINYLSY